MRTSIRDRVFHCCLSLALPALATVGAHAAKAAPVVPGTGQEAVQVGDDFEQPDWQYIPHWPKSTKNLDEWTRTPTGESQNGRWYEGMKRGQPDIIRRVATPKGGLPGSNGSLLLRSLHTGIPRSPSYQLQQDDFIADVNYKLGGAIPVSQTPSVVVRVFLPPVDQWENRSGPHFALRTAVDPQGGSRYASRSQNETYYPGMFVEFESKTDTGRDYDSAHLRFRANQWGSDFKALELTQTGWWTLGLSFTPDGQVHYYAKPGVEELTEKDHITSQYPYGHRCRRFKTFFFNVCNGDDGKTWSTAWIIDDPSLYYIRR